METIKEPTQQNTPREHDVNVILEKDWVKLKDLLKERKVFIDFRGIVNGVAFFCCLLALLTTNIFINIVFNLLGISLMSVGFFCLFMSSIISKFKIEPSDEKIKNNYFQILVFLNDYSKIHKVTYYINKENSELLNIVEKNKLNEFSQKQGLIFNLVLVSSFIMFLLYFPFLQSMINKKLQTLEKENKILKEKLEKYEKK